MRISREEKILWFVILTAAAVFAVWPVAEVLICSFFGDDGSLSIIGWKRLFSSHSSVITASLYSACAVTAAVVPLAFCIALFLARSGSALRRPLTGILLLSLVSPPFVGSMAFIMLFGRRGLVTWTLLSLDWNPYGFGGVVLMECFSITAPASLLLYAVVRGVDRGLENASLDLGMGRTGTLARITLPLCLPGIAAAALLVFARSLSDFSTPLFVGGRFQVLASKAYMAMIYMGDFRLSAAMSSLLLLPAAAAGFALRRLHRDNVFSLRLSSFRSGPELPCWLLRVTGFAALAYASCQILVYALILAGAFSKTWGVDFTPTAAHIQAVFQFRGSSILRSLGCAFSAAALSSVLGIGCAAMLRRMHARTASWIESVLTLPYVLPGTFFGLGYLIAFTRLPFEVGASVLIAMNCLFRQLTPALRASAAGLASIPPEQEKAARDLGAGPASCFFTVMLPQLRHSAAFSFVNTFSASVVSTGPIIFLVTPYAKVMSVDMFESINSGKFGEANAMAVCLIGLVLLVEGAVMLLYRRGSPEKNR